MEKVYYNTVSVSAIKVKMTFHIILLVIIFATDNKKSNDYDKNSENGN